MGKVDLPMAGPVRTQAPPVEAPAERAEEPALVARAAKGDRAARAELFDRYLGPVYEFVFYRVGRRPEIAEEVTQEVFARALAHMDRYDPARGDFGQWLGGISRNAIRDLARRSRAPGCALPTDPSPVLAALPGRGDPAAEAAARDGEETLLRALSALPERYREVLRWKYLDGLSVREIAGRTRTTEKAVEGVLGRARSALKDGLGEGFGAEV
jgi:RNA polymerase sigma-70 factor (ECF subfamily)